VILTRLAGDVILSAKLMLLMIERQGGIVRFGHHAGALDTGVGAARVIMRL